MDTNKQYHQGEAESLGIFNVSNGDVKTVNGQQYHVIINNNGTRSLSPVSSSEQALNLAKQAQQMQVQANQPAISTLQGQQTNLQQSYKTLLDSVMQQGTVAQNYAQTGENNLLGQRGITNNSPYYDQQMTSALLPVQSQFNTLAANVGQGSAQDINTLASQIAGLQAGNVPGALQFGGDLAGLQNQFQIAQLQSQTGLQQTGMTNANNIALQRLQNQFQNVPMGNNLVNTLSGVAYNPSTLTSRGGGAAWLNGGQ